MLFVFLKCVIISVFIFRPWKAAKWFALSTVTQRFEHCHHWCWCFIGFVYGFHCSICQEKKVFKSSSAGIIQTNSLSERNYLSWFFKLCSFSLYQSRHIVIQQHHETIYSTVEKPAASQTSPRNNTISNKVETIYDTPSQHVCNILPNLIRIVIL